MKGVIVGWTPDKELAERCLPRDQREHPDYNLNISEEPGKGWGSSQDTVFVIKGEHK